MSTQTSFPPPSVGLDERSLSVTTGEYLPKWTCHRTTYHVVFRLFDSLPLIAIKRLEEEIDTIRRAALAIAPLNAQNERNLTRLRSARIAEYLDTGRGACHMRNPEVAECVSSVLLHFDGVRYLLHAWCVMPNHVHVLVEPLVEHQLIQIVHSWKSYSAKNANRILGRTGPFWQRDYYNHIVRTGDEFVETANYIWFNPNKAGYPEWRWRGRRFEP